jgi:hypothetical protein
MIVQVKELPERARQPLLVALSLQALATQAASAGAKEVAEADLGRHTLEFAGIVEDARREGWASPRCRAPSARHAAPAKLKEIADLVWTIGLARLQQLVAAGQWYPDELDLVIKPREEPLVSRDHLGIGAGATAAASSGSGPDMDLRSFKVHRRRRPRAGGPRRPPRRAGAGPRGRRF